jgi:hypothetical protein
MSMGWCVRAGGGRGDRCVSRSIRVHMPIAMAMVASLVGRRGDRSSHQELASVSYEANREECLESGEVRLRAIYHGMLVPFLRDSCCRTLRYQYCNIILCRHVPDACLDT